MRYVLAVFLFAHGMVHGLWFVPPPESAGKTPWPFTLATSPILSPMGVSESMLRPVGSVLIAATMLAFALSALGAAGVPGLESAWTAITLLASALSIVLTVIFWNPQLPLGALIDAALIVTILGSWWPATLVK